MAKAMLLKGLVTYVPLEPLALCMSFAGSSSTFIKASDDLCASNLLLQGSKSQVGVSELPYLGHASAPRE